MLNNNTASEDVFGVGKKVEMTWAGYKAFGKVSYKKGPAARELINNYLVDKSHGKKVSGQFVIDLGTLELSSTDNFVGFNEYTMADTMNVGWSYPTPAILSEHGMGMLSAVEWWGDLEHIHTSRDGHDFFKLIKDKSSPVMAAHLVRKSTQRIQRYNTSTEQWEDQEGTGSQIRVNLNPDNIPTIKGSTRWGNNLKRMLEVSYHDYLGSDGTLSVHLILLNHGKLLWESHLSKPTILLASPIKAVDYIDRDGVEQKGLGFVDKNKSLGPNEWCIDQPYKCKKTGIIVDLKVGRVPHIKNVENHYFDSLDKTYNPNTYKESHFTAHSDFVGLSYCKSGVPIKFGNFRPTSRDGYIFGFIDIKDNSIGTVKTKDDIMMTTKVEVFERELQKWLGKKQIYVRALSTYMPMSEAVMEENLIKKLRRSSNVRKYLGFKTSEFSSQYRLHSGAPDIVNLTENSADVLGVIEIKKEGQDRLYKALAQGMAYAQECGVKKLLIVAQDVDLPTDIQLKVDIWLKDGWDIRYEQYQKLMDL